MNYWDERFSEHNAVYGKEPNQFFKQVIDLINPGSLLLPGEGEGRNAIYASKRGWDVTAFDSSKVAKQKALKLAKENDLNLTYLTSDYLSFKSSQKFDAIALIFTHLERENRKIVHNKYLDLLNPNGTLILQMFSKEQLGLTSGGPKSLNMLVSVEELEDDFQGMASVSIESQTINLNEGPFHQGEAKIISLKGIK